MRRELSEAPDHEALDALIEAVAPLRKEASEHEVFEQLTSVARLRTFMEHHIYAVWDFMSLLKALQRELTCVSLPWVPRGHALNRHLINDIVLEEESDQTPDGGFDSHFDIHRRSMDQIGADRSGIDHVVEAVREGQDLEDALEHQDVPKAAGSFVRTTWNIIQTGDPARIAAAFTLGREDLIPDMFQTHISSLHESSDADVSLYHYYLERHIELDEEEHGPMALRMLVNICGNDAETWANARESARETLQARISLWDAISDSF